MYTSTLPMLAKVLAQLLHIPTYIMYLMVTTPSQANAGLW